MTSLSSLKEHLSRQRALVGLLQAYPNPVLAEMAGLCGYDFMFLDGEHGLFSEMDYVHTVQTLTACNALAFVRLANHDLQAIGRYLDIGVDAIVVPNVATAEQATALARAMEYPPVGTRGFGAPLHRATRYGLELSSHLKAPREGACLLPIIESAAGVANVEEILAVEGVDGVIVGPSDLALDLGCPGDFAQALYREALLRIEQAATSRGKLLGTAPHSNNPLDALYARGHRFFILDDDVSLIREAMSSQLTQARALL